MKFAASLASIASFASLASAINIIISNDDSYVSSNIRATYQSLKNAGHNVFMFAPAENQSGKGGTFSFPSGNKLERPSEFGDLPAGSPAWGYEESDNHIWYFNGTPAASVAFGIDYAIPQFFSNIPIDLVVSGPNEGANAGAQLYTLSGTIGATYYSVGRGIPAIAFSADISNHSYYKDPVNGWLAHKDDESFYANIYAKKVTQIVNALVNTTSEDNASRLLPLGVGINVNMPYVGAFAQEKLGVTCPDPEIVYTRLTGGAQSFTVLFNATSGTFVWSYVTPNEAPGINTAINGDVSLPGETTVSKPQSCQIALSAFSVDYDAPLNLTNEVHSLFEGIFSS